MPYTAETLQFAVFKAEPGTESPELWDRLFDEPFVTMNRRPGQQTQTVGAYAGYAVELQDQLNRSDLIVQGTATPAGPPSEIPDLEGAIRLFLPKAVALAQRRSSRLAIVVQRAEPAADAADAIQQIERSIEGLKAPEGALDLTYQVNAPTASSDGLSLHRLCRWSVGTKLMVEFMVSPGGPIPTTAASMPEYVVAQYYDVFTAPGIAVEPADAQPTFEVITAKILDLVKNGYAALR